MNNSTTFLPLSWEQAEQRPWLKAPLDFFLKQKSLNRISHAVLIHSPDPLEAKVLSYAFAQGALCANPTDLSLKPCGLCDDCQRITSQKHADVVEVGLLEKSKVIRLKNPDGGAMQIKEACDWAGFKSKGFRIVMINPASQMNASAANALLKTLEEPSDNKIFILLATQLDLLPATIISRCQIFNAHTFLTFHNLEVMKAYWAQVTGDDHHGIFLMTLSQMRFDLALDWFEKLDMLSDYFQLIFELSQHKQGSHTLNEQLQHWPSEFLIEALVAIVSQAIYRQVLDFASEKKEKEAQLIICNDEVLSLIQQPTPHLFQNTQLLLQSLQSLPYSYLGRFFDDTLRVRALLHTSCDKQMLFENLWVVFEGICQKNPRYLNVF